MLWNRHQVLFFSIVFTIISQVYCTESIHIKHHVGKIATTLGHFIIYVNKKTITHDATQIDTSCDQHSCEKKEPPVESGRHIWIMRITVISGIASIMFLVYQVWFYPTFSLISTGQHDIHY